MIKKNINKKQIKKINNNSMKKINIFQYYKNITL